LSDEFCPISDDKLGSFVFQTGGKPGKILLGDFYDLGIDLHKAHIFDWIAKDFLEHTAVSSADDQDASWLRMGEKCWMNQHLMIEKLILFSCLDQAI